MSTLDADDSATARTVFALDDRSCSLVIVSGGVGGAGIWEILNVATLAVTKSET